MQLHALFLIVPVCIINLISSIISPSVAHAETRITDDTLLNSTIWSADGSPYILETSITVPYGRTLTVESGVTIDVDPALEVSPDIAVYGNIIMRGSPDGRITVKGISDISVYGGTTTISSTDILIPGGLYLSGAYTHISSSTISGAYQGIYIGSGETDISASRIENNEYGIWVQGFTPIFQVKGRLTPIANTDPAFGLGAPFSTLALATPPSAVVKIVDSSIAGNTRAAIKNTDTTAAGMVQAVGNWWGTPNGPTTSPSAYNTISGTVSYDPWLDHDPTRIPSAPICCSSILFLPGLESSRLYVDGRGIFGTGIGWGTSTNTLWEPNRNADVRKLFLNPDGSSIDPSVYSGGAIDTAWGYGVYGKFMDFLNNLVSGGDIQSWDAFGYDWRKPIADVVVGPEKKATTTTSLVETALDLAAHSKTGKVTLIAHSNGGLVAKYLTKTLTDMGKDNIIDSVISVAVPYLGTPEAVGGILHGDDESLLHGLLLKQSVARQLGQNMASAYSLLPSAGYFAAVPGSDSHPVISFASSTPRSVNDGSYPTSISSVTDESAFISDVASIRPVPQVGDIETPLKGNQALMASAVSLHNILDTFSWPSHIARWAIAGWNALTTSGISYHASKKDLSSPTHDIIQTNMGDGTVVASSATYEDGTTTMIDLGSVKASQGTDTLHGNILESSVTQGVVRDILVDSPAAAKERAIASIPGVTVGSPDYSKEKTYIVMSTHSPVQLHVYDSLGRHTGETTPPPGVPTDLFRTYESEIPGSSFRIQEHNDTDYDTFVSVPDDGNTYSAVIEGTGVGSFAFDIDRIRAGETFDHAEYADLPVTPLTVATTTIQLHPTDILTPPGMPYGRASSTFMADIRPLSVDIDGDGTPDINAKQGSTTDPALYWEAMKKACTNISIYGNRGERKGSCGISTRMDEYHTHEDDKDFSERDKRDMACSRCYSMVSSFTRLKTEGMPAPADAKTFRGTPSQSSSR